MVCLRQLQLTDRRMMDELPFSRSNGTLIAWQLTAAAAIAVKTSPNAQLWESVSIRLSEFCFPQVFTSAEYLMFWLCLSVCLSTR